MRWFLIGLMELLLAAWVPALADDIADLRARADQGDASAQINLGVMYGVGQGVVQAMLRKAVATRFCFCMAIRPPHICGSRSSYRKFGLDRYWRDARTLTLHDPVDRKLEEIGLYDLTGAEPPVGFYS